MLNRIVRFALEFHGLVLALAVLLVAYGCYVAAGVKLDVFPEFVQPQVTIQAEAPGLAPEQVEVLVTRPIETAVNGTGELESIRSESIQGLSVITVVFKEGTDIYRARIALAERLAETAGQLPEHGKPPKMSPMTSSTMDLLKVGLLSKTKSPRELRTFADFTLRPRLLAVAGVARVNVFGGEVRQIQVQVKPERLLAFDLTLQDVIAAAKSASGVRGAGFVETPTQRVLVQTEGQSLTPAEVGAVVVAQHEGVSVRLRDVAEVVDAAEPKFGDALVMGEPGVLLTTSSQFGANTMEVTEGVERALEELKPVFESEGITVFPRLHRPATFIEHALRNVQHSLVLGAIFVGVVLFFFLLDLRTACISFVSIPLSLLAALLVLDWRGVSINTMTLGGFAVAIGVVVDDAIIDVENILRRLRENLRLAQPRPVLEVVLDASIEVRSAVVYATFIVAGVFLPVLMMTGLQGRFFAPLAEAFILAILASLAVALTVTPALCLVFFSRVKPHAEPRYLTAAKALHLRLLRALSGHAGLALAGALVLFVGAAAVVPFLGGELLPSFREGHFVLQVSTLPGTSLPEMMRLGRRISAELLGNPHIATVEQQIGRAEQGEDTWGTHRSEFHVELKPLPAHEEEEVQEEIRRTLASFPGTQSEVLTFLGDRIGETISGETAPVVVNIFGDDLDTLDVKAREVATVLGTVPGAADVQVKSPPGASQISIRLRPERLTQFGFRPLDVLEALQTAYQGTDAAQLFEGNRVFELAVVLDEATRANPEAIAGLLLSNAEGVRLPLRELADVTLGTGRSVIQHDGARRRQTVTCNPEGRDVTAFVAEARARIAEKVKFPAGVYPVFSGVAEEQARSRRELALHSLLAVALIALLLSLIFRQPRNLLLVLANLPFALVGGVLAVLLTGASLSIGSLVGFVTLFGISMRNSIMMVAHFEHLVTAEGGAWNLETALRGAAERFVPVAMTALVTGLGVLPLALGAGEAGREIEGPMAIVILGGLLTSTALNLLVLPVLALRFGRFGAVS
jgi:CzcA family heavy metal efflux pump